MENSDSEVIVPIVVPMVIVQEVVVVWALLLGLGRLTAIHVVVDQEVSSERLIQATSHLLQLWEPKW